MVVFFVMGPKKIPELARAVGQARGEFAAGAVQKPSLTGLATALMTSPAETNGDNAQLIETAEKLGIPTKGLTPAQISDAIVSKVAKN